MYHHANCMRSRGHRCSSLVRKPLWRLWRIRIRFWRHGCKRLRDGVPHERSWPITKPARELLVERRLFAEIFQVLFQPSTLLQMVTNSLFHSRTWLHHIVNQGSIVLRFGMTYYSCPTTNDFSREVRSSTIVPFVPDAVSQLPGTAVRRTPNPQPR